MELNQIVAGALFDFLGYLTSRPEEITLSDHHEPHTVLAALGEWSADRGLDLDEAEVQGWQKELKRQEA